MSDVSAYTREDAGQPPSLFPAYASTVARSPRQPLVRIPQTLTETTGPDAWSDLMGGAMADLTTQHKAMPQGQRIIVSGHVLDESGGKRAMVTLCIGVGQGAAMAIEKV